MDDKRGAHELSLSPVKPTDQQDIGLSKMRKQHRYLLEYVSSFARERPSATILDYGCGPGQVVFAARKRGIDAYGTDTFFGGTSAREGLASSERLGDVIREMVDNKIPFEDDSFDLVLSNQVFEHVDDLDGVLDEINRVMKKDAVLLSLFSTKENFREGHIGIPFAHRLKQNRFRYYYTFCLRSLGLGQHKENKSNKQWTKTALDWVDKYTVYYTIPECVSSFSRHFAINMAEQDYIKFRLSARKDMAWLSGMLDIPLVARLARMVYLRLAGVVILAEKKAQADP